MSGKSAGDDGGKAHAQQLLDHPVDHAQKLNPTKKHNKQPGEKNTKAPPKKNIYAYPTAAVDPDDLLSQVIFFGRGFTDDESGAIITADMSMATDQITQLEITLSDPDFVHAAKAIFEVGIPVKWQDWLLDINSTGTQSIGGQAGLDIKCQPRTIRALKKRRGARVLHNVSPSHWVKAECDALKIPCVVQPTAVRKQVSRKTKKEKGSHKEPSSWTTMQDLADDLGFKLFFSLNALYFCKEEWLLDQVAKNATVVTWGGNPKTDIVPTQVPLCVQSDDDPSTGNISVEVYLERDQGQKFRPGMAMTLRGVPGFNATYLVNDVEFSLMDDQPVLVQCALKQKVKKKKGVKDGDNSKKDAGTTSSLRYLLKQANFTGEGLEIAIAVAEAATKANAKYEDKSDRTAKWGSRVGLFAIRSLNRPSDADGLNAKRIKSKLLLAPYSAAFVYQLTNKGTDWSMFTAYTSGAYKHYYKKNVDYQVTGWKEDKPNPVKHASGNADEGTRTAAAFVRFVLSQTNGQVVSTIPQVGASKYDPNTLNLEELIEWACGRDGVDIGSTAEEQIAGCKPIHVHDGIQINGALLWDGSKIAVSLGNGSAVEPVLGGYGIRVMTEQEKTSRWQKAGLIRGMKYAKHVSFNPL